MQESIHASDTEANLLMKVSISRDKLVESVNHVMKAVSSRTTIPILTGIKLSASFDGITITGSDSDISIQAFIPIEENDIQHVNITKNGQIVLQAKVFSDIVKKLPGDQVDIEVDHRFMTKITSSSSEFNLNGLDAEEYPHLPEIKEEEVINIRTDLLKHVIRQTVFAVSTSETRPVLTGVNWKISDGTLICVATDSHRLASRNIQLQDLAESISYSSVVIPGKSLSELSKILDDNKNEWVNIVITENQILFKAKHIQFLSRLLDGNYPDTERLIPNESKTEITLETKTLLHAIDRASLLAKEDRSNIVRLRTLSDNQIEISSQSPEIGKVYEHVETKGIDGEELKISFSAKYMMDALSRIDSEEVCISFTGAMRPFVIRPTEEQHVLMLILPVRTF